MRMCISVLLAMCVINRVTSVWTFTIDEVESVCVLEFSVCGLLPIELSGDRRLLGLSGCYMTAWCKTTQV